jgi:hypothetical protein
VDFLDGKRLLLAHAAFCLLGGFGGRRLRSIDPLVDLLAQLSRFLRQQVLDAVH